MNQPGITSPIIGPRTSGQLADSLTALDIKLTEEDLKRLDEIAPPGSAAVSYAEYKGPHKYRW